MNDQFYCRECGTGLISEGTALSCPVCLKKYSITPGAASKCVARVTYTCGLDLVPNSLGNLIFDDRSCFGFCMREHSNGEQFLCFYRNFEEGGHGCLNTLMYPEAVKKLVPASNSGKE